MPQLWSLDLTVNGRAVQLNVPPFTTLAQILRDHLGLTGTKVSCNEGECGSCTVILNGKAVSSCLILAPQTQGAEVWTIEGLEQDGRLHLLQEAFLNAGAVQCGYCTPGFILSGAALLQEQPNPNRAEIQEAIEGNLCRCTGYQKIVEAIESAARELQTGNQTAGHLTASQAGARK